MPPPKKHSFRVAAGHNGWRLDRFVSQMFPEKSRSSLQKLIPAGLIRVDQKIVKASFKLAAGQTVEVQVPPPEASRLLPWEFPLEIVYEDPFLLVINKPAGLVVHPGAGNREHTLVNALIAHCRNLSGAGGSLRPGIVHRLDKDTSGLLVVAKDDFVHAQLQKQFEDKTARRLYRALVWGKLRPEKGELSTFLNRSKSDRKKFAVSSSGKKAVTFYQVEEEFEFLSLVRVWLATGRTHQIRAHFQYLHHPVFGDPQYSGRQKQLNRLSALSPKKMGVYLLKMMSRQALHAFQLGFVHPMTKEYREFTAPLPDDFETVLEHLRSQERDHP